MIPNEDEASDWGAHNGQITENHDLCTVTGGIEERPSNAIGVGDRDRREQGGAPSPGGCDARSSQTSSEGPLRDYMAEVSRDTNPINNYLPVNSSEFSTFPRLFMTSEMAIMPKAKSAPRPMTTP